MDNIFKKSDISDAVAAVLESSTEAREKYTSMTNQEITDWLSENKTTNYDRSLVMNEMIRRKKEGLWESEESLNELSRNTLKRYSKKAEADGNLNNILAGGAPKKEKGKYVKKMEKRYAGSLRAKHKTGETGSHMVKVHATEESLDELSRDTLKRYSKKASKSASDRKKYYDSKTDAWLATKPGSKESDDAEADRNKAGDKWLKRVSGVKKAKSKLREKEEYVRVEKRGKEKSVPAATLDNYIEQGWKEVKAAHPMAKVYSKKSKLKKIKEENINELSKKTLASYVGKAAKSAGKNTDKAYKKYGKIVKNSRKLDDLDGQEYRDALNKNTEYSSEFKKHRDKKDKRVAGINRAVDKLTRRPVREMKSMTSSKDWDDADIQDYFDSHPNLTLQQLARMTRKSVAELKKILMSEEVLDELSSAKLRDYRKKALDDTDKRFVKDNNKRRKQENIQKDIDGMKNSPDGEKILVKGFEKLSKSRKKNQDKISNRAVGIGRANRRLREEDENTKKKNAKKKVKDDIIVNGEEEAKSDSIVEDYVHAFDSIITETYK